MRRRWESRAEVCGYAGRRRLTLERGISGPALAPAVATDRWAVAASRQQRVLLDRQRSCSSTDSGGVFIPQNTWYIGSPAPRSLSANQRSR